MSRQSPNLNLRIDTSHTDEKLLLEDNASPRLSPTSPSGFRPRSASHSLLPSFRISGSQSEDKLPLDASQPVPNHGTQKARAETRKLLAHILTQLKTRPKPPSVSDALNMTSDQRGKGISAVIQSVKGAVAPKARRRETNPRRSLSNEDSDSEQDEVLEFTTDVTFDLMNQLKDVLVISAMQGWDIFHELYVRTSPYFIALTSYQSITTGLHSA